MFKFPFIVCGVLLAFMDLCSAAVEQTHLALTENEGEMLATFVSVAQQGASVPAKVFWGTMTKDYTFEQMATSHTYSDGGFNGTIFVAAMTNLQDDTRYYYRVQVGEENSTEWHFDYSAHSPTLNFLSYGDMGVKNSQSTAKMIIRDALSEKYKLLVNVGDISYADDYKYGSNAYIMDQHFREIEGYAARMPFMTVPGNHESQYNFAGYLNRLQMPKSVQPSTLLSPFYYSFDYGPVHFLVYSSEHNFTAGSEQWEFIREDLSHASSPSQRAKHPWIIMWSHRPLYCSDLVKWAGRCVNEAAAYRDNIEKLMVDARVDLHISGHNHQYERSYPVHGCSKGYRTGCNVTQSYHNAPAPVYIVNGAAGNVEGIDPTWVLREKVPFLAAHDSGLHTGYARVHVNTTALHWEFVYSGTRAVPWLNISTSGDAGKVIDSFVLSKS